MKRLLYCVLDPEKFQENEPIIGVGAQPIIFLNGSNLCAAVSDFENSQTSFDVSSMITYHNVIETLFKQVAIIPFRFKTLLNSEEELFKMLEEHESHYTKLLSRLDGVVEIGIRFVHAKPVKENVTLNNDSSKQYYNCSNPGTSYLASRRSFYSSASWIEQQKKEFSELCVNRFNGLFVDMKSEAARLPEIQNRKDLMLVSIYFLVKKDMVQKFRANFQEFRTLAPGKTLLSGPWPPYNFVA